ncbi:MAG: chemotaxis response regulator protein-glutamate methylesterase [Gammaproteobacteria bacterium]|nr:chemotaxis response regulator protein-glutamate methylesterase [Gammaproteobacteria bacterium]MCP5409352.1 chemotaxis response regulator protein-glutamate methylesterase [Chromatiaceae bacterium]MCP5443443.1 chemotaxis response regulator protein-glutamate methylesterase [Chromatiaceae bacterium]
MTAKVRVLVVDDSVFFQRRITDILQRDSSIEVVGHAGDGLQAVTAARKLNPDVITMDVEMPVMNGINAVKRIMAESPTPIIMLSAFTHEGAKATLDALDAGAVDFFPKPQSGFNSSDLIEKQLLQRILALGLKRQILKERATGLQKQTNREHQRRGGYKLVVIGASTGGPVAMQQLLSALPADFPLPLLLVVHMPESFTPAFAARLNAQCNIGVKEARDGDVPQRGQAYLAPGGKQMTLQQQGSRVEIRISNSLPTQTYRPSVDVTMGSAGLVYPDGVLGVVLTGMGADGKLAAQQLKAGGSTIWSQDEASCIVYGMPQAVEKAGLSDRVLPLTEIGPQLVKAV